MACRGQRCAKNVPQQHRRTFTHLSSSARTASKQWGERSEVVFSFHEKKRAPHTQPGLRTATGVFLAIGGRSRVSGVHRLLPSLDHRTEPINSPCAFTKNPPTHI